LAQPLGIHSLSAELTSDRYRFRKRSEWQHWLAAPQQPGLGLKVGSGPESDLRLILQSTPSPLTSQPVLPD
tara:strand:+ start:4141 stop:4353 length:213 start_codon:yes stop_codon:yes gene_type:complete